MLVSAVTNARFGRYETTDNVFLRNNHRIKAFYKLPLQKIYTRNPIMILSIICALTQNHAIGLKGGLLYYLPADLKHFKQLTTGHTILMGRKTFESLPKGALPNRRNLVVTHQQDYSAPGIEVFHSIVEALQACKDDEEVFVIGGESIYEATLPLAQRLCLTHIEAMPEEADTFFPPYDMMEWKEEWREHHEPDEKNKLAYDFVNYIRK